MTSSLPFRRLLVACVALVGAAPAAQERRPALPVYVTGRVVTAAESDARQTRTAAKNAFDALDTALKAKYGRDRKAWPEQERQARERAEADRWEAEHEVEIARTPQQSVDDSVEDLKKALRGAGPMVRARGVEVVDSRDAAVVVAEVLGRRIVRRQATVGDRMANWYLVTVKLSPGPKADPARFATIKAEWPYGTRQIRKASPAAPYWIIETEAELRWLIAADLASAAVNLFITRGYDALSPPEAKFE